MLEVAPSVRDARALRASYIIFFVFGTLVVTWVSRLPLIKEDLQLEAARLSIALLGVPLGLVLAMRYVAALIARTSSRSVAMAALGAVALAGVLPALAWNLVSLTVVLVALGAAYGTLDIALNTQAAAIERHAERPLMSGIHGWYSMGMLAGGGIGSIAAHYEVAPSWDFLVVGLAFGTLAVVASRDLLGAALADGATGDAGARDTVLAAAHGDDERGRQTAVRSGARTLLHPRVLLVGTIAFCCLFVEGAVDDWSGIYLHESQGATLAFAPLAGAAAGLGMSIGRFTGDARIARIGRRASVRAGALVGAAGLVVAVAVHLPWLAVVGYGVLGYGIATIVPIAFTLAGNIDGVAPALGISRVTTLGYAGLFAGPPVIGLVAHVINLGVALAIGAALLGVVAVIVRRLRLDD
ncbi:MAG: transporter [Thermoleophilia bacterium]|nr:transporter [Thermoleophilia bacterium]